MNNEFENFTVFDLIDKIEETNFVFDSVHKLTIAIDYRTNYVNSFLNEPYFKVYNSGSVKSATKVARIDMLTGKYVEHTDTIGKDDFKLSTKDKANLKTDLLNQCTLNGVIYGSTWEAMCSFLNNIKQQSGKANQIKIDYEKLKDTKNIPEDLGY